MTAVPLPGAGQPDSLIDIGLRWVAASAARRRTRRGNRPSLLAPLGQLLGTLAALTAFTIAAFAVGFALGMTISGVALLLLDFKISRVRRGYAASRPARR